MLADRLTTEGESVMMRGDNVSAVSWVNRCGGSRDRRAGITMIMLGRMEIESGWCQVAKHISGVENRLADDISRRLEEENNFNRLTQKQRWKRQELAGGNTVLDEILNLSLPEQTRRPLVEFIDRLITQKLMSRRWSKCERRSSLRK